LQLATNPLAQVSRRIIVFVSSFFILHSSFAESSNSTAAPLTAPPLSDAGLSLLRVFGALALVIGCFSAASGSSKTGSGWPCSAAARRS